MSSTLDDLDWPVRTERLVLRPATPADAAATFAYRSLPDVSEWLTSLPTDAEAWERRHTEEDLLATTVIIERDGVVLGDAFLRVKDAWSQKEVAERAAGVEAELGWVLAPDHQRRGYAAETVHALLRVCFEDLGLRRVTAGCFADNEPSWRLMEKVGMRREFHSRADALHRTRGWLDGFEYALLAEEWSALSPS